MRTALFIRPLLLLLSLCWLSSGAFGQSTQAVAVTRVAVFSEVGFPNYGVSPLVSPKSIVADLNSSGLSADELHVAALADPNVFNISRYSALVLPYGNTYPKAAFENMRVFHAAGGILVMSGVPFTHAVSGAADVSGHMVWTDLGHSSDPARFGSDGIGVGGFVGDDQEATTIPVDDPLGLRNLGRSWSGFVQRIYVASLPTQDEVIPILAQDSHCSAAMIVHHDPQFPGAIDVWTNHPSSDDNDAYDTEQLLVRGTFAALERDGKVTPDQLRAAYALMDHAPKPTIYANLTLPQLVRPYPTFQPKSKPPARHLYVADVQHLTDAQRLLLTSLQGIVNRKLPRIYLIYQPDDLFWLQEMQTQKQTDAPIMVADPMSLVKQFRNEINGAVTPDPKVYDSAHVAIDIAGQQDLVIATADLAATLYLPIKVDLRGKFKDDAEALHYARMNLLPNSNRFLAICLNPPFARGSLDQIIEAKGTAFWITGPKAVDEPGANEAGELREVEAMLAAMPLNAVVRGFYFSGDFGNGYDEGPGVTLASRFAKVTTVSDYVDNYSVLSGVVLPNFHQTPENPAPKYDPTKVYVSVVVSDGDNLDTWSDYFRDQFNDPLHGTFPIAWGMGPTMHDVAPTIAKWFYDHETPNDEFICDVSGVGYVYPPSFGTTLKNRDEVLAAFCRWTSRYMDVMDMKTFRPMSVHPEDIAQMASMMPHTKFLMPDYGAAGEPFSQMTYSLPSGQDVFRAATNTPAPQMVDQIRGQVGTTRPAFVNAFITNWGMTLSDVKAMLDKLGPDYVPVLPSQLDSLYRQAHPVTAPAP